VGARLLLPAALPVCAGVVSSFSLLAVRSLTGGPPLERLDWVAGAVFVAFASVALLISLRAARRVWLKRGDEHDAEPLLARVSPFLIAAGLVAGVFAGRAIVRSSEGLLERDVADVWCESPELLGFSDVGACVAEGTRCLHEGWEHAEVWQEKADALAQALGQRRAGVMAAQPYDADAVRRLDGLLRELRVRDAAEKRSAADRAGVACLKAAAPAP
jgi:hypothetical protein